MPMHEGTELPARGGNDWDVPPVVPVVDEDGLMPPAAYPRSARNKMNRMKPNAESVESLAMLHLDQCSVKQFLTTSAQLNVRQTIVNCAFSSINRV